MSGPENPFGVEVSYSKLRAHLECPLQFKMRYLDNRRTPPRPAGAVGLSLHRALELFHKEGGGDVEFLLECYDAVWVHPGFSNPHEEMEWYNEGRAVLEGFLEKDAKFGSKPVKLEAEFKVPLGHHVLRGMVDRVDEHPDGSIEVIDYKTFDGTATPEQVAEDLQLLIYGIGVREGFGLTPTWLTKYFIRSGERVRAPYDPAREARIKDLVREQADKMAGTEFPPDTSFCPRCMFKDSCRASSAKETDPDA